MARPVGRPGETRERAIRVALELFSEHGVGGTSLQMIADRLDVTKAAVYHQFGTKEGIVLAAVQPALDLMAGFVTEAEAEPDRAEQVDITLRGIIDLVIQHRLVTTVLRNDPAVSALLAAHRPMLALVARVSVLITGPNPDAATRIAAAMAGAGIMAIGSDPLVTDVEEELLRSELLAGARRLLGPAVDRS